MRDFYEVLDRLIDCENLLQLQLFSQARAVIDGQVKAGHYGFTDEDGEIVDLGEVIDVLPLARRPKAIKFAKYRKIVRFNAKSVSFKRIASQAIDRPSRCMVGVSFLLLERSTCRVLEFYCGSRYTRREGRKLYPFLPLTDKDAVTLRIPSQKPHGPMPVTLKVIAKRKKKVTWYVPEVIACETPFTKIPEQKWINAEVAKFIAPSLSN
jgi:hypothetical protein